MIRIGITGGIGSGKSVVSSVLRAMGYRVYDSDSRARTIMTELSPVRDAIKREFGSEAYCGKQLNRAYLAAQIFSDPDKRLKMNAIVHPAVAEDFVKFANSCPNEEFCFVESAILFEANLDAVLDAVWMVDADEDVRVRRAALRDAAAVNDIKKRVAAQRATLAEARDRCTDVIINDDRTLILPQILNLLACYEKKKS